jgi:glycyl-tRNA synthetase alpha subunit
MYVTQIKSLTDIMHEHKCMYLQMSTQQESKRSAVYLVDKSEKLLLDSFNFHNSEIEWLIQMKTVTYS